ncbi:MAG: hypothetical protein R3305_12430 [Gammaproteobacteria bacterium]|nr:hypothetical protein [Gammaproteobacteria bacterium]
MQRRELLKGLAAGVPLAAGAAGTAAIASTKFVKDKGQLTMQALEQRLDVLKKQFEDADERNRKLIKTALACAALSLGIDIGALL